MSATGHRFFVLIVVCAVLPSAQLAAEPADLPRHELVFARHGDDARSHYDLWRMCSDGTQLASLVVDDGTQFQPAVSPDGLRLAYVSRTESGQSDIYLRPFNRGEVVKLTDHPGRDTGPSWSPDGTMIAFFSDRDHQRPELYTLELETGAIERLTDNAFHDSGAAWSPDGTKLIWTRYIPLSSDGNGVGAGEIFELDTASGVERQVTRLGGYNGGLAFSPDGKSIAFHRVADDRAEIWIVGATGSDPRPITDTYIDEYSPEWSPDGRWLAVSAGVGNDGQGTFDLWLMRPDGTERHVIHKTANTAAWHKWRPGSHYCR